MSVADAAKLIEEAERLESMSASENTMTAARETSSSSTPSRPANLAPRGFNVSIERSLRRGSREDDCGQPVAEWAQTDDSTNLAPRDSSREDDCDRPVTEWAQTDDSTLSRPTATHTIGINEFVNSMKDEIDTHAGKMKKDGETIESDVGGSELQALDDLHNSASRESTEVRNLMRESRLDAAKHRVSAISQIRQSIKLLEESGDTIPAEKKDAMLAELTRSLKICKQSRREKQKGVSFTCCAPEPSKGSLEEGNRRLFDIQVNFVFEMFRFSVRYNTAFFSHPPSGLGVTTLPTV